MSEIQEVVRKNLANCSPREFFRQAYKIKKCAERWLKVTDILSIRKRHPQMIEITKDMSDEEKAKAKEENDKRMQDQINKNIMDMLDSLMDTHLDETLEVLALCCFVEPQDIDNYPVSFYLGNFAELIGNKDVISFFTSLGQLEQIGSPDTPKT